MLAGRSIAVLTLASLAAFGAGDDWFTRTEPAMSAPERKAYQHLSTDAERENFRALFWNGRSISELEYMARVRHADNTFGSGKLGSGANTDQGRLYIANGEPTAKHRVPSSRIFVDTEVWYYDSLPNAGYNSRLQFLFYKKRGVGDYKLYSPQLQSVRDLLIPQSSTRSMFPVNDIITANDLRDRLKYSPAEEEIIEAAMGVARGITGSENATILAKATSISHMLLPDPHSVETSVESRFTAGPAPETGIVQYRSANGVPVVDVYVRSLVKSSIHLSLEEQSYPLERTNLPFDFAEPKYVLYTQRFFLLPGTYRLWVEIDSMRHPIPVTVKEAEEISGTGIDPQPGDLPVSILADPNGAEARAALARQEEIRLKRRR